ncbi:MAG: 50S ribosomal protein L23 [Patescibacteria group bacterium]
MAIFKSKKENTDKTETKVAEKKTPAKSVEKKSGATMKADAMGANLILRPMVTEKAAHLASIGQYVFCVDKAANRIQVRSAIRAMYGVTPVSVNIQSVEGKVVRFGRTSGKRKDWKKAIVTLPKGKTIEVYEGV